MGRRHVPTKLHTPRNTLFSPAAYTHTHIWRAATNQHQSTTAHQRRHYITSVHQESVWKVSVYSVKWDYLPCVTWEKLCCTGDFLMAASRTVYAVSKINGYCLLNVTGIRWAAWFIPEILEKNIISSCVYMWLWCVFCCLVWLILV